MKRLTRRKAISLALAGAASIGATVGREKLRIATFSADVTVPIGHGMMGGYWLSKSVADPLEARGVVFLGGEKPVVFVSVDWCEIRNDAYLRWQMALAESAGTSPDCVMISAVHQHDAPIADLEAERILRERKLPGTICDLEFHEKAVLRVAEALRSSVKSAKAITHLGTGQAMVEGIASNRRYTTPDGKVHFDRGSSTRNEAAIAADESTIDPWLKTLSFWNENSAVAALSFYAVHPMSYYRDGEVSADFPGMARRARQTATSGALQIYCSGAGGNTTAGKYNDGSRANRPVLARRLEAAMTAAWTATVKQPVSGFSFRNAALELEPRESEGFKVADLEARLVPASKIPEQCHAAMGLSWRKRLASGRKLSVSAIDFGNAAILLLPGEAYVEYQLAAQAERPRDFICVAGYGDAPAGYIPTEKHWAENDANLHDWCWIAPGAESRLRTAIRQALAR